MNRSARGVSHAFQFGVLLILLVVSVGVGSWFIVGQLDTAAGQQIELTQALQNLDDLLKLQIDEEAGLRGYLTTHRADFLEPFNSAEQRFTEVQKTLDGQLQSLGLSGEREALAKIGNLHRTWRGQIASPLLRRPSGPRALALEEQGKNVADDFRSSSLKLRIDFNQRARTKQDELKRRINEAFGLTLAAVLGFGAIAGILNADRSRARAELERERLLLDTLQRAFLNGWDELPRTSIGTAYVSATREAAIGGDLFDVRRLDEHRGLVLVADMSGKGIDAAVDTAFVKYTIRALSQDYKDPGVMLRKFNDAFLENIESPSSFVVMFLGILDTRDYTLTYASAGHAGAFLRRAGRVEQLPVTAPLIGVMRLEMCQSKTLQLEGKDTLILATDGLTEARNSAGRFLDEHGAVALMESCGDHPQECADGIVERLKHFSGGTIADDLALVVITLDDVETVKRPVSAA